MKKEKKLNNLIKHPGTTIGDPEKIVHIDWLPKHNAWFKINNQQIELHILAKPHAKRSALLAVGEQELQIALHAKPHQGEANKELIAFLAKLFQIPKSHILLRRGEASRHKVVVLPLNEKIQDVIRDIQDNDLVKTIES